MKYVATGLICLSIVMWLVLSICAICNGLSFNWSCGEYIKQSADSSRAPIAKQRLKYVLDYVEKHDLTTGYTSVIYKTPSDDINFWYKNIKNAYESIDANKEYTQLEETNILIKLREVLLDTGGTVSITTPTGISRYPYNSTYFWLFWISCGLCLLGTVIIFVSDD